MKCSLITSPKAKERREESGGIMAGQRGKEWAKEEEIMAENFPELRKKQSSEAL